MPSWVREGLELRPGLDTPPKANWTSDWLQALARARLERRGSLLKALPCALWNLSAACLLLLPRFRDPDHLANMSQVLRVPCRAAKVQGGWGKSVSRNPAGCPLPGY